MLRLIGFATLVLIAICLAVSASIALADDGMPDDEAIPTASLVSIEDVDAFDFAVSSDGEPSPDFDEPSDILEI